MDKKKILVIDDEADLTRLIKLNLEGTGKYTVRTENSGSHGLVAAREFNPNLIFLDIMMPDVDGGDLCYQLENDAKTKGIPIVFLTGVAKQSEIEEGMGTIGGHPFIAKPVSLRALIDCIEKTSKA
ncbi:MAG: response regulator [Candidatus Omnitrophica bacterium]|nr:response regulator [Candidatus Omnitrophota bacterium]